MENISIIETVNIVIKLYEHLCKVQALWFFPPIKKKAAMKQPLCLKCVKHQKNKQSFANRILVKTK